MASSRTLLLLGLLAGLSGCAAAAPAGGAIVLAPADPGYQVATTAASPAIAGPGRGFPAGMPWASCYGTARQMGSLSKAASTFRLINLDADPDTGNFTPSQIATLKAGGRNRVISYLNLGSCEHWRSYWTSAPSGFVPAGRNRPAQLGAYDGYPDETWMDLANADYQRLIVDHVAPRLVARGVDGFYLDNLELVEHGAASTNGPCSAATRQGGLDLVRKLREKYPGLLIVMQNATSDVTRLGTTGGVAFATLLDGVAHEEVYQPRYDADAERELTAWRAMHLQPGGRPFWIGTEDYVGGASHTAATQQAYQASLAAGFSPYAADASGRQQILFYWSF